MSQSAVVMSRMGSSPVSSFFTGVRGSFVVALSAFEDSFVHSDGNSVDSYCPMLGYVLTKGMWPAPPGGRESCRYTEQDKP